MVHSALKFIEHGSVGGEQLDAESHEVVAIPAFPEAARHTTAENQFRIQVGLAM
jgi:hypothetical protein